jgi:Flp pilus assembly protein TadB
VNDSQITDLLVALGFTMAVLDWILFGLSALLGNTPHDTGLAAPSVVLIAAALLYRLMRRIRTRSALKRLKRELAGKQQMLSRIHPEGDV